jgi:hypothetical protein
MFTFLINMSERNENVHLFLKLKQKEMKINIFFNRIFSFFFFFFYLKEGKIPVGKKKLKKRKSIISINKKK